MSMHHLYLFIFLSSFFSLHPFYVSLTEIKYNGKSRQLEISQKVFWDDLELALSNVSGRKIDFLNPEKNQSLDSLVETYLLEHNEIRINGTTVHLHYLGYEIEEDAAWFYMESTPIESPNEVYIRNTILLDHFPGQQNIVNCYIGPKPKSIIARKSRPNGQLKF